MVASDELKVYLKPLRGCRKILENSISEVQHVAQGVGENSDKMKITSGETSNHTKEVGSSLWRNCECFL